MQTRHSDHDPGTIVLDLRIDTSAIERAFQHAAEIAREAARVVNRGLRAWARQMSRLGAAIREAANDEVTVSGLEARYFVRAGLDPAYRSPEDLDALVQAIMRGEAEDTRLLYRENRARIAAAALRGHVHAYPEAVPVLTWHRLIGGTTVVVTRG
jgi:hypothetical protein